MFPAPERCTECGVIVAQLVASLLVGLRLVIRQKSLILDPCMMLTACLRVES